MTLGERAHRSHSVGAFFFASPATVQRAAPERKSAGTIWAKATVGAIASGIGCRLRPGQRHLIEIENGIPLASGQSMYQVELPENWPL